MITFTIEIGGDKEKGRVEVHDSENRGVAVTGKGWADPEKIDSCANTLSYSFFFLDFPPPDWVGGEWNKTCLSLYETEMGLERLKGAIKAEEDWQTFKAGVRPLYVEAMKEALERAFAEAK